MFHFAQLCFSSLLWYCIMLVTHEKTLVLRALEITFLINPNLTTLSNGVFFPVRLFIWQGLLLL